MQFSWTSSRTIVNPLAGVSFNETEDERKVKEVTKTLIDLPIDTINTLIDSLGASIVYFDMIEPWTSGDKEDKRKYQQEQAAITYRAALNARTAFFIRDKVRPASWSI